MKIPEIFIPEKDLESKVNSFVKEQPVKSENDKSDYELGTHQITDPEYLEIIQKKAEQITIKLGRRKNINENYIFKDKKTKLTIKYGYSLPMPFGPPIYPVLRIYRKKGLFRKEKLFEAIEFGNSGTETRRTAYKPDDGWIENLNKLYFKAQQK